MLAFCFENKLCLQASLGAWFFTVEATIENAFLGIIMLWCKIVADALSQRCDVTQVNKSSSESQFECKERHLHGVNKRWNRCEMELGLPSLKYKLHHACINAQKSRAFYQKLCCAGATQVQATHSKSAKSFTVSS